MNIAIVGAGVSGLHAAATLHELGHTVSVFEASDTVGGHVQTLRVPFGGADSPQEAIVDLGVFMFDPLLIHPYLAKLIEKTNTIAAPVYTEIPLNFTLYINKKNQSSICWKTDQVNKKVSKIQVLVENLKKTISDHGIFSPAGYWQCFKNIGLMKEIFRFHRLLETLSTDPENKFLSIDDFVKKYSFSPKLIQYWILPQMHCWWGSTRESLSQSSIQVFADSVLKVSLQPQYTLTQGVDKLIEMLSEPIKPFIKTSTPVKRIIRSEDKVIVNDTTFDAVLLAIPPSAALKLLDSPEEREKEILNSFTTTTTTVFLHTDELTWLPVNKESWSTINLIQNERDNVCTFWVGRLHPLMPSLFLTWGDQLMIRPAPDKILKTAHFLRTLPTLNTVKASEAIHDLQGKNRTWYCGAHVHALKEAPHSLWSDNALQSGYQAAQAIHESSTK